MGIEYDTRRGNMCVDEWYKLAEKSHATYLCRTLFKSGVDNFQTRRGKERPTEGA